MIRYIIISFLILSCQSLDRQNVESTTVKMDTLKYIEFKEFEAKLESGSSIQELHRRFDVHAILLLDTTKADQLYQSDIKLQQELNEDLAILKDCETVVGFYTELNNLKDVLNSPTFRQKIFTSLFQDEHDNYSIDSPIYIRENDAVINIQISGSHALCYAKLNNGIVHLYLLNRITE